MTVTDPEPVSGAYCAVADLRVGDIPLPAYVNKEQRVVGAAEEIDAAIGHLYKTPIEFLAPDSAEARPYRLTLKKINYLIASGRIILDAAAASENQNQHAYGMGMLKEGLAMLEKIRSGDYKLVGAILLPTQGGPGDFTGPVIMNEDPVSLVESFYSGRNAPAYGIIPGRPRIIFGSGPPS